MDPQQNKGRQQSDPPATLPAKISRKFLKNFMHRQIIARMQGDSQGNPGTTTGQSSRQEHKDMKPQKRWMTSIVETAKVETTQMPWQRGNRRAEMIARRKGEQPARRTA